MSIFLSDLLQVTQAIFTDEEDDSVLFIGPNGEMVEFESLDPEDEEVSVRWLELIQH